MIITDVKLPECISSTGHPLIEDFPLLWGSAEHEIWLTFPAPKNDRQSTERKRRLCFLNTCGSVASGWDAAKIINNTELHHLGLICQLNQTKNDRHPLISSVCRVCWVIFSSVRQRRTATHNAREQNEFDYTWGCRAPFSFVYPTTMRHHRRSATPPPPSS